MFYKKIMTLVALVTAILITQEATAQIKTDKAESTEAGAVHFQINQKGAPEGASLDAQIARAEFYKAQYPNDVATQAKYQETIDELKKQKLTPSTKQD